MGSSWLDRRVQISVLVALSLLSTATGQTDSKQRGQNSNVPPVPVSNKAAVEARKAKLKDLVDSAEWVPGKPIDPNKQKVRKIDVTADGFIRFLSLANSSRFNVQAQKPEQAADAFVNTWRSLLIGDSAAANLRYLRTVKRGPRSYVRYQQIFADMAVYGAEVIVKVNGNTDVARVISGASTRTGVFESGGASLNPGISGGESQKKAVEWVSKHYRRNDLTPARLSLMIFDPLVVGWKGPPQLVWSVEVTRRDKGPFDEYVFVNAQNGQIVFNYSRVFQALDRHVRDANDNAQVYYWGQPELGGDV